MPASFVLTVPYPAGTDLDVYPRRQVPDGVPTGVPVTSAVSGTGPVIVAGLDFEAEYIAWAGTLSRGVRFRTGEDPEAELARLSDVVRRDRAPINALDYGAPKDGVGYADAALAAAAAAAAQGVLVIPPGRYRTAALWRVLDGTTVEAEGAVFLPEGETNAVEFGTASRTPLTNTLLTADAAVGDFEVPVSPAAVAAMGLAKGQRVQLRNPTFTLGGVVNRRETNVIDDVDPGTGAVTLRHPLGHPYTTAQGCTLAPVTTVTNVTWRGGTFDMSGVTGGIPADCDAIVANFPEDCVVEGVMITHHPSKGVAFYGGLNSAIRDCNGYVPALVGPGQGYTNQLEYCRNCRIEGGWSRNVRHHSDIVGGQANVIDGGFLAGRTTDFDTGADLHGMESRWCVIRNFTAVNASFGVLAGNGTFDADYDFTFENNHALYCDTGMRVMMGAQGRIVGGSVTHGDPLTEAIEISHTASVSIEQVEVRGTMLRGVYSTSSGDVRVFGCRFRGAGVGIEHVRADAGTVEVGGCSFPAAGTAVRAASTCTKVTISPGNAWGGSPRIFNNAAPLAVILGTSRNETEGTAPPTAGTWRVGDICWNTAAGPSGIPFWYCTTAGTSGTWKAAAALAA